jgi:glycosyltransferase involved in cell wall biosynthesis
MDEYVNLYISSLCNKSLEKVNWNKKKAKTLCINVFSQGDLDVLKHFKKPDILYNNEKLFFQNLHIVKQACSTNSKIFADNENIRNELVKYRPNLPYFDNKKEELRQIKIEQQRQEQQRQEQEHQEQERQEQERQEQQRQEQQRKEQQRQEQQRQEQQRNKKYIYSKWNRNPNIVEKYDLIKEETPKNLYNKEGIVIVYDYLGKDIENNLIQSRLKNNLRTWIIGRDSNYDLGKIPDTQKLFVDVKMSKSFISSLKNLYTSNALNHLSARFLSQHSLLSFQQHNPVALFFGLYDNRDIETLEKFQGLKFVMFGGSDCNIELKNRKKNVDRIKKIPNLYYLSISPDIQQRLNNLNIQNTLIELNLVDKTIFKPVSQKGKKIFIYNGLNKCMENIYGKEIYTRLIKEHPEYEFVLSNQLNIPYNQMPNKYAECFIGLRLTQHDGNANMVQEMEAMGIPVVHNHSNYGLKWKNYDDIVNYIRNFRMQKVLIQANINLNNVDGATIWWSNLVNTFIKEGNEVIYVSNYKINNDSNTRNIENKDKLQIINPCKNLTAEETKKEVEKYGEQAKEIIIRSELLLKIINSNWNLLNKTIIYGLDIHAQDIGKLENKFKEVWTQSPKLKELLEKNNVKKITIKEPMAYKYDFNLPERNDNEIRLIYTGTLRNEENILEIIEEFKKIHAERPEVLLTMCYGKIHGNKEFQDKVNKIIKEGVKGITFKHNLSHKDCCYEMAKSDIGICWRKNGWGDNGEVSTKVKEYENTKISVITNNYNLKLETNLLYFDNSFYYILKFYSKKYILNDNRNQIIYLANTSFPQISGYTVRTENILKEIKKKYKIICFVKPDSKNKFINIFLKNDIIYYKYNDIKNYKNYLINYLRFNKNIKIIWSASDNFNGILGGEIKNILKLKSIYEIRGFWHYTRKYFEERQNKFNKSFFYNYNNLEKKACQLNDFILCENDKILEICNKEFRIPKEKLNLLKNGVDKSFNIIEKDFNSLKSITFGYIGSIVSYEGIIEFIEEFKKINNKYKIEFLIIGGGQTEDAKKTINILKNTIHNCSNIKYLGQVPHDKINQYYEKIDIICLPRINCEVCNIVTPLKPYEAMMNGKIIFASSVEAISDIIMHDHNGILFDKNNLDDLKYKIIDILNLKYDLNKIIRNGYKYCKNNTWEKTCKNVLSIITNILK